MSTALTAESAGYDVTITAASNDYDYVARYFAPHKGIDEDPVTGSMHTGLAPLWLKSWVKHNLSVIKHQRVVENCFVIFRTVNV